METGKTIQGGVNLTLDAVAGTTHIVEQMHRNIAATPWPIGRHPEGPTRGITGFVYRSIRAATEVSRSVSDVALAGLAPLLDQRLSPGPHREAVVSVLNGVCGDHLQRSDNKLAIPMKMRVLLPGLEPVEPTSARQNRAASGRFAHFFDTERRPVEIFPQPDALVESEFSPGSRILLLAHGLCMNDREWTARQHNHAEVLAQERGYTPVYVVYNSGLNVSTNGRELSRQIAGLLEIWPVPVESITFVGFSMGGLIGRSAMHTATSERHAWLQKVDRAVYIGTPHHGAAMERGGFWLQKSLSFSPYTAPLTALGRFRSAGITDLRHGNLRDDDWQHHDKHEDNGDYRQPIPLQDGIEHYAIAATRSKRESRNLKSLASDDLVHPHSALGIHRRPEFNLQFAQANTSLFAGLGHMAMLYDERILNQLREWL